MKQKTDTLLLSDEAAAELVDFLAPAKSGRQRKGTVRLGEGHGRPFQNLAGKRFGRWSVTDKTIGYGKYTVTDEPGHGSNGLHALRYGEQWRDLVGDGLIYSLASELEDAIALLKKIDADDCVNEAPWRADIAEFLGDNRR